MSDIENAVQTEETTENWLMGCTICDEGLCNKIDELIEQKKLKQSQAIRVVTNLANEQVGTDLFKTSTIKRKYYVAKGIHEEPKKTVRNLTKKSTEVNETPTPDSLDTQEQEQPQEHEIVETPQKNDADELAAQLTQSIKAIVAGLKAFNELDQITQDESLKQELAFNLVDVIPEVKAALNRINKNE